MCPPWLAQIYHLDGLQVVEGCQSEGDVAVGFDDAQADLGVPHAQRLLDYDVLVLVVDCLGAEFAVFGD